MKNPVASYPFRSWREKPSRELAAQLTSDLEGGKVLYFPDLAFPLLDEERKLLSPSWSNGKAKNISYDPLFDLIKGAEIGPNEEALLRSLLKRYANSTQEFIQGLFPAYSSKMQRARTSYRPVEVAGRVSSITKDDSRLHVDSFPSRPTNGKRILRVFCNINPSGVPRHWRIGEPFSEYAKKLLDAKKRPLPFSSLILGLLRVTRARRSPYDHYMLQLHDKGKQDEEYQKNSPQTTFLFPPGSTWICYTDQVLHAAMGGQYMLEQTYHVPASALEFPERSPLRILEAMLGKTLVPVR